MFCLGAGAGAEAWLSLEKNLNLETVISTASFSLELLWGSSGVMGAIAIGAIGNNHPQSGAAQGQRRGSFIMKKVISTSSIFLKIFGD